VGVTITGAGEHAALDSLVLRGWWLVKGVTIGKVSMYVYIPVSEVERVSI
jgi:hypothetical protein